MRAASYVFTSKSSANWQLVVCAVCTPPRDCFNSNASLNSVFLRSLLWCFNSNASLNSVFLRSLLWCFNSHASLNSVFLRFLLWCLNGATKTSTRWQ
jgi:hypothetical protein